MLALTKKQLLTVIETRYDADDKLITQEAIKNLFEAYGDEYFHDYGYGAPWKLTRENEAWKNMRGLNGVPKINDKKHVT